MQENEMDEIERDNGVLTVFGEVTDTTKNIIKVVGVGGGGCNAVNNLYEEGLDNVTFAVCNTDSKSLSNSPVPCKVMLGSTGLGAGANPSKGLSDAEESIEDIRKLFNDNTQMVYVVAALGGGTGTGAGPLVAGVAKSKGLLTIGIVTLPFYFERKPKIIKALKGLEEMRKNVDALLIINNQQLTNVFRNSHIIIEDAFKLANDVTANAVRGISELITLGGLIQTDFSDVKATMQNGGGAIMAIGRASGERRVQNALLDALDSPLLYGNDISHATRILFNIYTSKEHQLFVDETDEIDAFMEELNPNVEVIWGMAFDDSLGEDAKITIIATGIDNSLPEITKTAETNEAFDAIIDKLYGPQGKGAVRKPVPTDDDTTAEEPDEEPEPPQQEDPAKRFLERVKNRIIRALNQMVEPE